MQEIAAFEDHTSYIKGHKVKGGNVVSVTVFVSEDYNPETDGYEMNLQSFLKPLSLPQDNSGTDDISLIVDTLKNCIHEDRLHPGTFYTIRLVECRESDGHPHYMKTWGIDHVQDYQISMNEIPLEV